MIVKPLGLIPLGKVIKSYTVSVTGSDTGSDTGSTSGVGSCCDDTDTQQAFCDFAEKVSAFHAILLYFTDSKP